MKLDDVYKEWIHVKGKTGEAQFIVYLSIDISKKVGSCVRRYGDRTVE